VHSESGLGFAAVAAIDLAMLVVLFTAVFGVAVARRRFRYVDVVWGAAFALVAILTTALTSGHGDGLRRWLLTLCTVIWGLRLSVHIARRGRGAPEDPRYAAMLARAGGNQVWKAFTKVFLSQSVLVWFISLPVQVGVVAAGQSGVGRVVTVVGVLVWLVGVGFEAVGDWQLARFKSDLANRGRLMTTGLWRYTRHPNYFGDACVWWGLFLIAAGAWPALLTVLSPVLMTWLLTAGSGKPLVEAHLSATRPGYADYVARTSAFLPRPPKQRGSA
jgi:steroid 5-alpha reductase family enzyme